MIDDRIGISLGLIVDKTDGELILQYLRRTGLLNLELKIIKEDDNLIIPINDNLEINQFNQTFNLKSEVKLVEQKFEKHIKRYSSISEVLRTIIPQELYTFIPVAFDQIGTIAIVDIKKEILAYKHIIGNAILEVQNSVKTVFRKSKAVSGLTRLRGLELIAGTELYETVHKEHGIKIYVDVKNIYFSPRLSTEHRRIALEVKVNETILDMFGAAAPFGLHIIALQAATVYSVDINPKAPNIIKKSIALNSNLKGEIKIIQGDIIEVANDFVSQNTTFDRIIMNHPSDSRKYLKLADKLLKSEGYIHFYSFIDIESHDEKCQNLIDQELRGYEIIDITKVRQYSPSEYHTCITIRKV